MVPLSQSHLSTLLRVKSTNDLEVNKQLAASPGDAQPRFRKNNWKRVTEAVPSVDQEAEGCASNILFLLVEITLCVSFPMLYFSSILHIS